MKWLLLPLVLAWAPGAWGQEGSEDDSGARHAPPPGEAPLEPAMRHAPPPGGEPVEPAMRHAPPPGEEPVEFAAAGLSLRIMRDHHFRLGAAVHMGWSWASPSTGWSVGLGFPLPGPPVPGGPWGVYQDHHRLTVPQFLDVVGEGQMAADLDRRVTKARRWHDGWLVVAGAGVVTALGGWTTMQAATTRSTFHQGELLTTLGLLVTSGALFGRSVSGNRAWELEHRFEATVPLDEAQALVEGYNAGKR